MHRNESQPTKDRIGFTSGVRCVALIALIGIGSHAARAQRGADGSVTNPVYLADAPVAVETIERAQSLVVQGSAAEAARSLGQLIVEQGDLLTPRPGTASDQAADPTAPRDETSIPIRTRVEDLILGDSELLDAYRRINSAKAHRLMEEGLWKAVERDYWLTPSGFDASLNLAQTLIESAQFGAGVRVLDRAATHPDAPQRADRGRHLAVLAYHAWTTTDSLQTARRWSDISGQALSADELSDERRLYPLVPDEQDTSSALAWKPLTPNTPIVRLEGIVPSPIANERLTPYPSKMGMGSDGGNDDTRITGASGKPQPWSMPVVAGDALITNDGVTISCFDRFTLRPRWRVTTTRTDEDEQDRTSAGVRSRLARTIEDLASVTVRDGVVYVAAGLARTGARTGDDRILALDLRTGSILHSTTLAQLDPTLEGASVRGSVIVDGDTLIVAARKNLRRERLVALSLVGFDRHTFTRKWTRQIGSSGSLPFQQIGQIAHSGVLSDGVVYWTDIMGLACALETATGRVVWAKAMPSSDVYGRYERDPWTVSTPIVRDDSVFVLSVDGRRIHQLEKATGREITSATSMISGQGMYLIETPDEIGCVNLTSITLHSAERFGTIRPRAIAPGIDGQTMIQGRVAASGSTLIVPVEDGLTLIDTSRASGRTGSSTQIQLETSGIVVALDGQILVVDENEISSYLSWDIARRLLSERVEQAGDLDAAITLSDLALRSGNHDAIIPAIDRAITMLRVDRRDDPSGDQQSIRSRLFTTIIDMVGLPGSTSTDSIGHPVVVGSALRAELLDRGGMIARTPDQNLAQLMTRGAWDTALGETSDAVAIYHEVLQDRSLSSGMWRGDGLAIRAELEATHKLNEIVDNHGRQLCAVFDELAMADLEALGMDAAAAQYEELAKRYPWAPTTPRAWMLAAQQWQHQDNASASVWAARTGLDSIDRLSPHGIAPQQPMIDSLGSLLVTGLIRSQRDDEAARIASQLIKAYPSIALTMDGKPIDAGSLWSNLTSKLLGPPLGDRFVRADEPTLTAGSPVRSPLRTDFDTMVLFAPQISQARMIQITSGQPELLWTRRAPDDQAPVAVVHNAFQTILQWAPSPDQPRGGSIEAIETRSGETRWTIGDLGGQLSDDSRREPDEIAGIDRQFTSPTEGAVPIDQILTTSDGSVMVVADRIGRAMAIDLITGQILWKRDLPISRVHDMDLRSGVLGVIGTFIVDAPQAVGGAVIGAVGGDEDQRPRIVSIDVRTGQSIQMLDAQTASPRWVRVAPSGNLIVGTNLRVMSVSTRTGTLDWIIHSQQLLRSNSGWVLGDTLVVLDEFVNLWTIGIGDGTMSEDPLNSASRVIERGWIDVRPHDDDIVVAASAGLAVFNAQGTTIGIDPGRTSYPYIGVGWGSDRVAMVKRASSEELDRDSIIRVPVQLYDQNTAKLLDTTDITLPSAIQGQPISVQSGTGVVVVGFGEVSVILETH